MSFRSNNGLINSSAIKIIIYWTKLPIFMEINETEKQNVVEYATDATLKCI